MADFAARALEHVLELHRGAAARLIRERHKQLADLLAPAFAWHRLELPGVHAKGKHAELRRKIRHLGKDGLDPSPHLGAMHEHPAGASERLCGHAIEARVLLERVFELAPVRHDGVRHACLLTRPSCHLHHQRRVVGVDRSHAMPAYHVHDEAGREQFAAHLAKARAGDAGHDDLETMYLRPDASITSTSPRS